MPMEKIQVLVWSEGTEPRDVYPRGMNADIAGYLNSKPDVEAKTSFLSDPGEGLGEELLQSTDVLMWWGHQRHQDVSDTAVERVVGRVRNEGMGFIPLHSAHYSKPFTTLTGRSCSLGGWREDGKPEKIHVVDPNHPIADGINDFVIPQTEMYKEPFDIPDPEAVVFKSTFEGGEWFRSGVTFTFGKGRVFYFRPGHETFRIMTNPNVQKVLYNAVLWAARRT